MVRGVWTPHYSWAMLLSWQCLSSLFCLSFWVFSPPLVINGAWRSSESEMMEFCFRQTKFAHFPSLRILCQASSWGNFNADIYICLVKDNTSISMIMEVVHIYREQWTKRQLNINKAMFLYSSSISSLPRSLKKWCGRLSGIIGSASNQIIYPSKVLSSFHRAVKSD